MNSWLADEFVSSRFRLQELPKSLLSVSMGGPDLAERTPFSTIESASGGYKFMRTSTTPTLIRFANTTSQRRRRTGFRLDRVKYRPTSSFVGFVC